MTQLRYPPSAMVPDYLVSGTGLVLSLPPLVLFELPAFTTWLLGAMGLAFAVHGLGVIRRQRIRVETDEDGLWVSPPRRRIAWNEVTRFGLAYFSTRRDGARGWMELRIASPAATLRVDSRLERFDDLVGRAWSAASSVAGWSSTRRPVRTSTPWPGFLAISRLRTRIDRHRLR